MTQDAGSKRLLKAMGVGFVIGAVGYIIGKELANRTGILAPDFIEVLNLSMVFAVGIGFLYSWIGLFGVAGSLFPKTASIVGNASVAQDIEDNRPLYLQQSLASVFLGLALVVLALSGTELLFEPLIGFILFLVLMACGVVLYLRTLPHQDELVRLLSVEATICTYAMIALFAFPWLAAAHVGLVVGPGWLGLLSMIWGFMLLSVLIVNIRRGVHENLDEA